MAAPAFPPQGFGLARFLAIWPLGHRQSDSARVAALSRGVWGTAAVETDTLGRRNQRSLTLHQALCGSRIEAQVVCPDCGAENEAELPVDELLAMPDPVGAVTIETKGGRRSFGLPRLEQLDRLAEVGEETFAALASSLARDPGPELGFEDLKRLSAAWEAADPAGAIALSLRCSHCGRELSATVDLVRFVARDLDLLADRLMREVDAIAYAYGWSEGEILALPPERRRPYLALASAHEAPAARKLK